MKDRDRPSPSVRTRDKQKRDDSRDRKSYYIVSPDLSRNPSDFLFVNKGDALIDGRTSGLREHPAPGFGMPFHIGVPPLRQSPRLTVGIKNAVLDMYGMSLRFVSNNAKCLLERIDHSAFEFVECETYDRKGDLVEPYWLTAVIRVVDSFDENNSDFVRYADRFPEDLGVPLNYPAITQLNHVKMQAGFPSSYHAFYLVQYRDYFIFDDLLRKAWDVSGLCGVKFSPLQPPTKEEFRRHLSFVNYPYWTNKGFQP